MKNMVRFFGLLVFVVILSSAGRVFAQLDWTWYIYSTDHTPGSPGTFDLTIGIRADSGADVDSIGNHNLQGTMSSDLYDFDEGNDPVLQTDHLTFFTMTVTNPSGSNNWRLNSTLDFVDNGDNVPTGGIPVATIRFYIKNSGGTSSINLGSLDETYEEDNTTKASVSYDNTGGDVSLPVQMANMAATANQEGGITIAWQTHSETDCAGFRVWRSESREGSYEQITTSLIPGQGNSSTAFEYTFVDVNVHGGIVYWYKIEEVSTSGNSRFYGPVSVMGVDAIPTEFGLSQNYPNPFNPETTFEYQLPEVSDVTLRIYSLLGKMVREWIHKNQSAGYYTVNWNGTDDGGIKVPSGIYLLHIRAGSFSEIRKMTIMR